jgi:hypothetical protein
MTLKGHICSFDLINLYSHMKRLIIGSFVPRFFLEEGGA